MLRQPVLIVQRRYPLGQGEAHLAQREGRQQIAHHALHILGRHLLGGQQRHGRIVFFAHSGLQFLCLPGFWLGGIEHHGKGLAQGFQLPDHLLLGGHIRLARQLRHRAVGRHHHAHGGMIGHHLARA